MSDTAAPTAPTQAGTMAGAGVPSGEGERGLDPVDVIMACMRLGDRARREGLLSLEEDLETVPGEVFQLGIQEVVDGTPPEMLAQIMDAHIEERRMRREEELRRELLVLRLAKAGVLAVQRGDTPALIRTLLAGHLHPADRARLEAARRAWLAQPARPPAPRPAPSTAPGWNDEDLANLTFDHALKLSHRDLVRVTRELDSKELALALRGASEEVQARFLQSMSNRAATAIREEMQLMGPQRVSLIEEAQGRIVETMRRMAQAHRIGGRPEAAGKKA